MRLLADGNIALDEALLQSVFAKAAEAGLTTRDLEDCVRLFCMVCNHVDELRFELRSFSQSYQLEVGDHHCAIVFRDGSCAVYSGDWDSPDVTFQMDPATALNLFMGRINSGAAHMNGDIRYKGTKDGAIRLQSVWELFLDEVDARSGPARSASK